MSKKKSTPVAQVSEIPASLASSSSSAFLSDLPTNGEMRRFLEDGEAFASMQEWLKSVLKWQETLADMGRPKRTLAYLLLSGGQGAGKTAVAKTIEAVIQNMPVGGRISTHVQANAFELRRSILAELKMQEATEPAHSELCYHLAQDGSQFKEAKLKREWGSFLTPDTHKAMSDLYLKELWSELTVRDLLIAWATYQRRRYGQTYWAELNTRAHRTAFDAQQTQLHLAIVPDLRRLQELATFYAERALSDVVVRVTHVHLQGGKPDYDHQELSNFAHVRLPFIHSGQSSQPLLLRATQALAKAFRHWHDT